MRNIFKRKIIVDKTGRTMLGNSERLVDNGRNRLHHTHRQAVIWCPGCGRPVTDVSELAGRCDYCRTRTCCAHCETHCQVCARRLCGNCRRGFVGSRIITVCPICLIKLRQRQHFEDQMLMRKAAIQNWALRQQQINHINALRLQAARSRMIGHIQASRIRTNGQLALIREINRVKLALAKMWCNGGR
ncbi:MAG: hypothetical protein JXB29_07680 [Sedimentisphaerales bacterium]|nr:hypothetical protein [Sedimentisphaerales bacterium]